jgi:hypothetical protein
VSFILYGNRCREIFPECENRAKRFFASEKEILSGFDEVMAKVKDRPVPDWDKMPDPEQPPALSQTPVWECACPQSSALRLFPRTRSQVQLGNENR